MPLACVACHFHFPCYGTKIPPPRWFTRNHVCSWGEQSEESSPQIIYCFGATTRVELNTFVTGPSVWCIEVFIMIRLWLGGQLNCRWSLAEESDLSLLQSKPGSGTYPASYSLYTGTSSCSSKWPSTKLPTLLHQLPKFRMHGTLYLQSSVNQPTLPVPLQWCTLTDYINTWNILVKRWTTLFPLTIKQHKNICHVTKAFCIPDHFNIT